MIEVYLYLCTIGHNNVSKISVNMHDFISDMIMVRGCYTANCSYDIRAQPSVRNPKYDAYKHHSGYFSYKKYLRIRLNGAFERSICHSSLD